MVRRRDERTVKEVWIMREGENWGWLGYWLHLNFWKISFTPPPPPATFSVCISEDGEGGKREVRMVVQK